MSDVKLHLGDCLDVLPTLAAGSVQAIITDLPYGTTACAWDVIIPFAPMWERVKSVLGPRGAFVTTSSQPFTSALVMSNPRWFKYEWIWEKDQVSNPQLAKIMPLKNYESVLVFGDGAVTYNPQALRQARIIRKPDGAGKNLGHLSQSKAYQQEYTNYPKLTIRFECERGEHPTQKPVALMAYLISTYTNPGDTVLDLAMGSGTTGVACMKLGRNFIGIEKDPGYFAIAQRRIADAQAQLTLPLFAQEAQ